MQGSFSVAGIAAISAAYLVLISLMEIGIEVGYAKNVPRHILISIS